MAKWSRLISEQKNSGLTIRDFCRQHDLSWHAYYYWLKKIREQIVSELPSGSAEQQPVFTELPVYDKLPASMPEPTRAAADDIVTIPLLSSAIFRILLIAVTPITPRIISFVSKISALYTKLIFLFTTKYFSMKLDFLMLQ